jgi:hypothetical protein
MHHSQIKASRLGGIRLLENPNKIVAYLSQFEKLFYFIFFWHGFVLLTHSLKLKYFQVRSTFHLHE